MLPSLFLMFLIIIVIYVGKSLTKIAMKRNPNPYYNYPPGPLGLPFIGNFFQFDTKNPHEFLWKLSKKYGPLMSLKLGSLPILVISSAKMAKLVFKNHDQLFSDRRPSFGQLKLSYNSLDVAFVPYGDYWREMRKVFVLHLFSSKMVQSFRNIREEEISLLITKLKSPSQSSSSSSDDYELVNLSALSLAFTSTLICRIAFGKNFDNNDNHYYKKRFDAILLESQAMMGGFFVTDIFPFLSWIDHLIGKISRLNKNFKELDLFYQELIQERLTNSPNIPKSMKNDVLDLLIQIKQEHNLSSTINFTWDHVKALLMDIFIAGTDTSAATIVWTMTALIKNPSKLKRLQSEIRNFARNRGRGLIINEDEIQELSYLKAVVKEAMRMYPPLPLLIPRQTSQQCIIEGYKIEQKTIVYINAWAIGRDPECWDHNPDEFLPERFLSSHDDHCDRDCEPHNHDHRVVYNNSNDNFGLIPFGAGRRGCPGVSLGLATVELAIANLVYSFDWELPHGVKHEDIDTEASPGITMHKKNALFLIPKQYIV